LPINPATGEVGYHRHYPAEAKLVMENIKAILTEAGLGFSSVVKTTIFLKDMANLCRGETTVYGSYLTANFPARETVQVAGIAKRC
jgi:2-iminobutanoate/2-iminopropanoate deaminase